MTALNLDHVSRRFGGLNAVDDLSMGVIPGRITGLIGPNGAGKTTTVNLITGLLRLDTGTIHIGADDISRLTPVDIARAGIGRTFQNIRLLKEMTVLDNIVAGCHRHDGTGLVAKMLGLPRVGRQAKDFVARADGLIQRFGLERYRGHLAGELSYGHQRRVEIARALALAPRFLLLDEPAAGMNDAEADELGRHFRALATEGIGVLLIEHNMRLVMDLCDHIYVLASGALIASGDASTVQNDARVVDAYLGH
jgi:branched-chain amino acid transport system ATP-binding protein